MKKIIIICSIVGGYFLLVAGISAYLGPNDLKSCGDKPSETRGCERADAIVAVSGGDTLARADEAIALYKSGWAPLIIFSGAAADKSGPSNAEVMQQHAVRAGISENSIVIEDQSETTEQNAVKTKNIFDKYRVTSAIVVTSAYHERRAVMEFSHRAPSITFRAHPVASDNQWGAWWWLTPTGWYLALSELVKILIVASGGVVR